MIVDVNRDMTTTTSKESIYNEEGKHKSGNCWIFGSICICNQCCFDRSGYENEYGIEINWKTPFVLCTFCCCVVPCMTWDKIKPSYPTPKVFQMQREHMILASEPVDEHGLPLDLSHRNV